MQACYKVLDEGTVLDAVGEELATRQVHALQVGLHGARAEAHVGQELRRQWLPELQLEHLLRGQFCTGEGCESQASQPVRTGCRVGAAECAPWALHARVGCTAG